MIFPSFFPEFLLDHGIYYLDQVLKLFKSEIIEMPHTKAKSLDQVLSQINAILYDEKNIRQMHDGLRRFLEAYGPIFKGELLMHIDLHRERNSVGHYDLSLCLKTYFLDKLLEDNYLKKASISCVHLADIILKRVGKDYNSIDISIDRRIPSFGEGVSFRGSYFTRLTDVGPAERYHDRKIDLMYSNSEALQRFLDKTFEKIDNRLCLNIPTLIKKSN